MGNVYEALVGFYWLEGNYLGLTDLFLTLMMDLDQIEDAQWTPQTRRTSVGFLRSASALKCTRFVFIRTGRAYGYVPQRWTRPGMGQRGAGQAGLAPAAGTGHDLWIPEWQTGYEGAMPLAEHLAPPPPPPSGLPQGREGPGGNTTAQHAAPGGEQREGPTQERGPSPGGTREGANRTPVAQEGAVVADADPQLQNPYDPRDPNTNTRLQAGRPRAHPPPRHGQRLLHGHSAGHRDSHAGCAAHPLATRQRLRGAARRATPGIL